MSRFNKALEDYHRSVGRTTQFITTDELKDMMDLDQISNKLTEDSPILNAQIGSAFMTIIYANICNDIEHEVGLEHVSDAMLDDVFIKYLVANASIIVTKNAKTFLKKRKKLANGISVYSNSFYIPKTGEQMSFRVYLSYKPMTIKLCDKEFVIGGHEELTREYFGELSKYSSQTSISDDRIIGYLRRLLMAKLPVYEIDITRTPFEKNDGRGERTELYYNIVPYQLYGSDGNETKSSIWNLHATRTTTIGENFMRDISSKEKVQNSLQPFMLYSHNKNCEQKSKTLLNQSNDGGGFIISAIGEKNDLESQITDRVLNIKIMGEMMVSRKTANGREYKIIAKLVKANLDIISFTDAIEYGLIAKEDVTTLLEAYVNGMNIVISNDNPIKNILELNDETVDVDHALNCPVGYFGVVDVNSRLKLDPGASFNGVIRSLPLAVHDHYVESGYLGANSSGILSFKRRALSVLNVTPYDIIGKPIVEPILYVVSQEIKDYLTGGANNYAMVYRFPLDGNFALCRVVVNEQLNNNVKPTCYTLYTTGGDFDGDGIVAVDSGVDESTPREVACEILGIFDTRKTTSVDDFLSM